MKNIMAMGKLLFQNQVTSAHENVALKLNHAINGSRRHPDWDTRNPAFSRPFHNPQVTNAPTRAPKLNLSASSPSENDLYYPLRDGLTPPEHDREQP